MKRILLTLSCVLSFQCTAFADAMAPETVEKLKQLRTSIRGWARSCTDGTITNNGKPNTDGTLQECPMGDMTIFAGLLCLSGERDRCADVKRAQDESGRWWRSPGHVGDQSGGPTFSRDQSKGVLAYLVATQDKAAAEKWMNYIDGNDYRLCSPTAEGSSICDTRATFWAELRTVWQHLGLPLRNKMSRAKLWLDAIYSPIETAVQPADYPMHLTAASVYIAQEMEKRGAKVANSGTRKKQATILSHREPKNAFFHYLASGADEAGAKLILDVCPATEPSGAGTGPDWIWQRAASFVQDGQTAPIWTNPSGWDCIFAINLYLNASAESKSTR